MKKKITSKRLRGMMLVPLVLAMMMPTKVAAQNDYPTINQMFKTWHISSAETGDTPETEGKIIQGYYIPKGVNYKVGDEIHYVDYPVQMQIVLKENTHSYINRIPFVFRINSSGVTYVEGKDIQCRVVNKTTGYTEDFRINNGDEFFFDRTDIEYQVKGNVYVWSNGSYVWKELTANFDITDLDRITYSTTEGFYKPADGEFHVDGDWSAAFTWNGTSATQKIDVTNWDGKQGNASMDPVYEITNGEFTYSASKWQMPLWGGKPYGCHELGNC